MLLVVNAGSSSLKLAVFDDGVVRARQVLERVSDPVAALRDGLAALAVQGYGLSVLTGAAHRVVHGGVGLTRACRVDDAVLAAIEACIPLAPLHNPANLAAMRALALLAPDLPQFASFDTAFHATNPEVAWRYALPPEAEALGIRRFGFHGLSYAAIVRKLQESGENGPTKRLLALHLGNGASLCAILGGQSVATTMGYSPLSGLTMGSRSGDIDGNAVLRLAEVMGIAAAGRLLNQSAGLLGLGGASDMRALLADGGVRAGFARAHFIYWLQRHAGSMIAAMQGLDAVVFTGGIGENDADLRAQVMAGLGWAGPVPMMVIPAEEERQIAHEAGALIR